MHHLQNKRNEGKVNKRESNKELKIKEISFWITSILISNLVLLFTEVK
jgi:hypothetical protein